MNSSSHAQMLALLEKEHVQMGALLKQHGATLEARKIRCGKA